MRTSTKVLIGLAVLALGSAIAANGKDLEVQTVSGRVVSVDAKAGTLTVRPETAALEPTANVLLRIDDRTKLRKSGLRVALSDIRPGDTVTANFEMSPESNLAVAVLVE
jgi:hypothetical protein